MRIPELIRDDFTVSHAGRQGDITNREGWLHAINGLKSPSEQQRLLVLLAEKKNRTTTDEKTLSALIRAEKTAEKAAAAKAEGNGNHSGRTEGSRKGGTKGAGS
ncbi:hypothetical protein PSJ75_26790 [Escherichia coli]|nr:hypothetical protein [Escherichia coli]